MAKISCLSALFCGNSRKSKDKKVSYTKRIKGNDCPKVKPVEFMDAAGIAYVGTGSDHLPARDTKVVGVVAETAAESAREDRDEKDDMARALCNVDLVGGADYSSGRSSDVADKDTISAAPDVSVSGADRTALTGLSRLERSCSNIETAGAAIPMSPSANTDDMARQQDGYSSDTHDEGTVTADAKNKEIAGDNAEPIPSQWVAFSAEASSLDRVRAWVSSLPHLEEDEITEHDDGAFRLRSTEIGESSSSGGKSRRRTAAAADAIQASSIVQTLNVFSSVAHISGMGLKVLPMISAFSSIRAVNLSGNLIAQISPGSLPKGLHSLDLSRNKIATIEGLRELTRLRVLNLSYNRITRIGHGLSSCTAIRELYLAGNKISNVEGLHRLLKLAVLDLSFNRITTPRDLGQVVANYSSLRAINLLGNQVQTNVGDCTLRKAVTGLLPRLEYLNKQAVRPQRAREAAKDSVTRAALRDSGRRSRRRPSRRLSQNPGSSSTKNQRREGSSSRRISRSCP